MIHRAPECLFLLVSDGMTDSEVHHSAKPPQDLFFLDAAQISPATFSLFHQYSHKDMIAGLVCKRKPNYPIPYNPKHKPGWARGISRGCQGYFNNKTPKSAHISDIFRQHCAKHWPAWPYKGFICKRHSDSSGAVRFRDRQQLTR